MQLAPFGGVLRGGCFQLGKLRLLGRDGGVLLGKRSFLGSELGLLLGDLRSLFIDLGSLLGNLRLAGGFGSLDGFQLKGQAFQLACFVVGQLFQLSKSLLLFSLDGFKLRIESRYLLVRRGDLGVGRVQRALYFHQRALIGGLLRQAFDLLGKRVLGGGDFLQADFQRRDFVGGFLELCKLGCGVRLGGGAGDLLGGDLGIQIVQLGFLVGQLVFCLGEQNLRFRQRLFQLLHLDGGFAVIAQRLGVGGLGGGKIAVGYVQLILQAGDIKLQGSDAFFQGGYLGLQFALIADGQGQVVQQRIGIGLGLGKFGLQGGDIGVGGREIGFLFGQYKRLRNEYTGVLTGKGLTFGGSLARTEATGYGLCYFTAEALKCMRNDSFAGKTVVISGSGNVAIYACEKATQLGGKVVTMSDSNGYVYDPNGIDLAYVKDLKEVRRGRIKEYAETHEGVTYVADCSKVWTVPCDIALPCATQNEINKESAEALVKNGCTVVCEGANMPSTPEAIEVYLSNGVLYGPAKAANAGGVATSGLEMSQNSERLSWTFEEVDAKLKGIMEGIFHASYDASVAAGSEGNLMVGANCAGFLKVATAMMAQGITY